MPKKPERILIKIGKDGVRALNYPETRRILRHLSAEVRERRLSHIVPVHLGRRAAFTLLRLFGDHGLIADWTRTWRCDWHVDLSPVSGPVLGPYEDRDAAIKAEVEWLARHYFRPLRTDTPRTEGHETSAETSSSTHDPYEPHPQG